MISDREIESYFTKIEDGDVELFRHLLCLTDLSETILYSVLADYIKFLDKDTKEAWMEVKEDEIS
jgi:hypothetical protein